MYAIERRWKSTRPNSWSYEDQGPCPVTRYRPGPWCHIGESATVSDAEYRIALYSYVAPEAEYRIA